MPPISFEDPRLAPVKVSFPPPSLAATPRIDFPSFRRDKGTKCVIGVTVARELGADHVMFFDADDLLHHRIAEHANDAPGHPGWYSDAGYIHTKGSRSIQLMASGFHHKNGSTGIVRTDLTAVPEALTTVADQKEIYAALTVPYVDRMFGEHGHWAEHLAQQELVVEPLPFPGAVWEVGTGENLSGNLISGRRSEPISPQITEAFGLRRPTRRTHLRTKTAITTRRLSRRFERLRSSRGAAG